MGSTKSGWSPAWLKHEGTTHWILVSDTWKQGREIFAKYNKGDYNHKMFSDPKYGLIIDPTAKQFKTKPEYHLAMPCGFLTKQPSKRAVQLMNKMLWQ